MSADPVDGVWPNEIPLDALEANPHWTEPVTELRPDGAPVAEVVTLEEFVAVDEPAPSALGDGRPLIPEGGDVMFYGDGGAGKTTLAIDLAFHLAAGDDWLGFPVASPVRVLLIENEGPRPLFRKKLRAQARRLGRLAARRPPARARAALGRFSFADARLARAARRDDPRARDRRRHRRAGHRSGMDEAGTLQEVRDFMALVDEVRELPARRVAFVLSTTRTRAARSPAPGRASTTRSCTSSARARHASGCYVQKARWSSPHHETTLQLAWARRRLRARRRPGPRGRRASGTDRGLRARARRLRLERGRASVPGQGKYMHRRRDTAVERAC